MAARALCSIFLACTVAEALQATKHAGRDKACVLDRFAKLGVSPERLDEDLQDSGVALSAVSMDLCSHGDAHDGLALTLANSSRSNATKKHKKPFMWVHTLNSGGSFVCAAAYMNQEKVIKPSDTCNWLKHDSGRGIVYPEKTTCGERGGYVGKHEYTWGQVQRTLTDSLCFQQFDYGFWMRDPLDLAEAEVNHKSYSAADVKGNLACFNTTCYTVLTTPFLDDETTPQWIRNLGTPTVRINDDVPLWMFFDNFVVRTLGGHAAFNTAPGNVTKEHFEFAKQRLGKFKVKLVMEKTLDSPDILMKAMGWTKWPVTRSGEGGVAQLHKKHSVKLNMAQKSKIKAMNKYDYMLYHWLLDQQKQAEGKTGKETEDEA